MTELVACLNAYGGSAFIVAPARELTNCRFPNIVATASSWAPRGPLLARPRSLRIHERVVVHVHGLASLTPWSPFLWSRSPAAVVATLHGVLDYAARHNPPLGVRGLWHRRLDVPLLRRLSALHVTRPSEIETAKLHGAREVNLLPWTLRDLSAERARPRAGPPFVLTVGRLHPIKGLERLLEVLRVAHRTAPEIRLLLAGSGSRSYTTFLSHRARYLGVRSRIEFLGQVDAAVLRSYYAEASLLALPSRYENFGMVVLEALRAGCPVVASAETPWEVLESEGAGRCVNFDDSPSAAAAITGLLGVASARDGARACYERRFAPRAVVPRFQEWYSRVAGGSGAASGA